MCHHIVKDEEAKFPLLTSSSSNVSSTIFFSPGYFLFFFCYLFIFLTHFIRCVSQISSLSNIFQQCSHFHVNIYLYIYFVFLYLICFASSFYFFFHTHKFLYTLKKPFYLVSIFTYIFSIVIFWNTIGQVEKVKRQKRKKNEIKDKKKSQRYNFKKNEETFFHFICIFFFPW